VAADSSGLDLDDETEIDTTRQREETAKARKSAASVTDSVLEKGLGFLWEGMADSQPPERKVNVPTFDFDWNEKTADKKPGEQAKPVVETEDPSQELAQGDDRDDSARQADESSLVKAGDQSKKLEGEPSAQEQEQEEEGGSDTEDGGKKKGIFRRLFRR